MDFFRKILMDDNGEDDNGIGVTEADFDEAYEAGAKVGLENQERTMAVARKYAEKGNYVMASLVAFVSTWSQAGLNYEGVRKVIESKGKNNPVNKLWKMIEAAFMSGDDEAETIAAMQRVVDSFDKDDNQ